VSPQTVVIDDHAKSILSFNESPDVPFSCSVNPYRGCEHGCVYCYARPYHEFLGFSAGLDFETQLLAKRDAAKMLFAELSKSTWKPQVVNLSGVTDCYQPIERELRLTRSCLVVLAELRHPTTIITKNRLVERDIDILRMLAEVDAIAVSISVTTLREDLAGRMEPRASRPSARLAAIAALAEAGIPVGVNVAPIIPGLTDMEVPAIIAAAAKAGARFANTTIVRLPGTVAELMRAWLERHEPGSAAKVMHRIYEAQGGGPIARIGDRMHGVGEHAKQIQDMFAVACRRHGLSTAWPVLSTSAFRPPSGRQESIFGPDGA
jgi:DNA repair photolyase